jgi:para-aminobenzoate synthetase component I
MVYDKLHSIKLMNELGAEKIPFLFIISFDCNKNYVLPLSEAGNSGIYYKIGTHSNTDKKYKGKRTSFSAKPVSYERYSERFDIAMQNLLYGNSYLLNLTFPSEIDTNLTLEEIFNISNEKYNILTNGFTCFSPETFVRIENGKIFSNPMKGTIDASIPNALGKIMSDPKENAEHNTIVDLIRNDLSMVARRVRVIRYRYADYLQTNNKTLIQISSEICGELEPDYNSRIGDIIFRLLPAGSVTGAPKKKTVEIILEAENYDRGYYTGIFGIFDGAGLDSAVMIRFIEKSGDKLIFKSGGGITAMSNKESEYQELIDKIYVPVF